MNNYRGAASYKMIIAIVLLGIFTIFIIQNTVIVEIQFLFWKLTLSRVILLFGSLLTGILIGLFIGWETAVKKKKNTDTPKHSVSQ